MKYIPLIFTTDSVWAMLEDRKTQTRRVIVPQPTCHCDKPDWHGQIIDWVGYKYEGREGWFCYTCGNGLKHIDEWSAHGIICPYGQVGDRLWVRETLYRNPYFDEAGYVVDNSPVMVNQTIGDMLKWRWKRDILPAMFMPREASRILLEITEIRAERLLDISQVDIQKEGVITRGLRPHEDYEAHIIDNRNSFAVLWDSLNAKRGYSWESNPWVWPISFRVTA